MAMNLGEAQARITLDISDLLSKSGQAQGTLQQLDGAVGRTGSGFSKFQQSMLGIGTALIAPMAVGLNAAVDLEQAIANINASLGGLPEGQLDALADEMERVGTASQFSAVEVSAVADQLAKAGFTFEDIVGGQMTEAVVNLSQATGTGLMTSVDGITAAMNLWAEEVVGVENALQSATEAADIFTIAANESSSSVEDIIAGVRNFGPMAAAIGVGFDETAAAIAFFTNNGLKAADSGVSLTRGIEDLMRVSQESPEILDQFGISLFDLEGNFVGLPALFDQLNAAFGDLSPEARQAGLSMLFGAESMDVMTLAALNGSGPMMEILGLMDETGVAAEQSALRMDTLNGQWETLKEGVTTLLGSIVSGLLPGLRLLVDGANLVVDALSRIPQPIQTIIGVIGGLVAGVAAAVQAFRAFRAVNMLLGTAGVAGGMGLGGMLGPLLLIAGAAGLVYAAFRTDFLGVRSIARRVGRALEDAAEKALFLYNVFDNLRDVGLDPVNAALVALSRVFPRLTALTQEAQRRWNDFRAAVGRVGDTLDSLVEHFGYFRRLGLDPVNAALVSVGRVFPSLSDEMEATQRVVNDLTAAWRGFRELGYGPVSAALLSLGEIFPGLQRAMSGLAGVTENLGDAFQAAVRGDWSEALSGVENAARSAWVAIQEIGATIGDVAVSIGNWVLDTAVPNIWAWLQDTAIPAMGAALVTVGNVIVSIGGWLVEVAAGIPDVWEAIKQWVLGTGAGARGQGLNAGAGLAAATGSGIPLGTVAVQIGDWEVVNKPVEVINAIADWVDEKITITDAEAARFEPKGREIGGQIMAAILDGIGLGLSEGPSGGGPGGGGEGPIGAGGGLGGGLWQYIEPILDGMWEELDGRLDAWEREKKAQFRAWWNESFSDIFQFDVQDGLREGGTFGSLGLNRAVEDMLGIEDQTFGESIIADLQARWDGFKEDVQGIFDDVPEIELPSINIDWGGWAGTIADGWQGVIAFFGTIIDWLKDPFAGVPDLELSLPSISIDWGPIDDLIEEGKEKLQSLEDLWDDITSFGSDDAAAGGAGLQAGGSSAQDALDRTMETLLWKMEAFKRAMNSAGGGGRTAQGDRWLGAGFAESLGTQVGAAFDQATATVTTKGAELRTAVQTALAGAFSGGAGGLGATMGGGAASLLAPVLAGIQTDLATIGTTIGTAAATWGTNLQAGLATMTAGVSTAFLTIQFAVGTAMLGIGVTIQSAAAGWAASLAAGLATMQGATAAAFAAIGATVSAGMSTATSAVVSGGAQMTGAMQSAGAAMTGAAQAAAASVAGALTAGMAQATAAVQSAAGSWAGIIAGAAGAMQAAGFSVGAAAGQGVVAGLLSTLGAVQAAASQIVATAAGAMAAAAQIASPSKVTMYFGEMMGAGLVQGLNSMQPAVASASAGLMSTAQPYLPPTAAAYGAGGTVVNQGPQTLNATIHTQSTLTDHEVRQLTYQIARAQRDAADIEFIGQGVTP